MGETGKSRLERRQEKLTDNLAAVGMWSLVGGAFAIGYWRFGIFGGLIAGGIVFTLISGYEQGWFDRDEA